MTRYVFKMPDLGEGTVQAEIVAWHVKVGDHVTSALRVPLLRWMEKKGITAVVAGEFDDSALMKSFGQAGAGVFPAPSVIADEVSSRYHVALLGKTSEIRERFFAITVERHVRHPAVLAVSAAAHSSLFKKKSAKPKS